jgi:hypothetical protein
MILIYILFILSFFIIYASYLIAIGKEDVIFRVEMSKNEKKIAMLGFLITGLLILYSTTKAIWF